MIEQNSHTFHTLPGNPTIMLQCPNAMTTFPTAIIDFSHVFQTKYADISQHIHIIFQHYSNGMEIMTIF